MGVTISFQGRLDDPDRIGDLIQECKEHCRVLDWPCDEVDQHVVGQAYGYAGEERVATDRPGVYQGRLALSLRPIDTRLRGLRIHPPGTETLSLTFDPTGQLVEYDAMPGPVEVPEHGIGITFRPAPGYWMEIVQNWVKTTGALQSHVLIVALLRLIRDRYMSGLEVNDDTGYWETRDVKALTAEHHKVEALLAGLRDPEAVKALLGMVGLGDAEVGPDPGEEPESPPDDTLH
jgi:hypothetical protein